MACEKNTVMPCGRMPPPTSQDAVNTRSYSVQPCWLRYHVHEETTQELKASDHSCCRCGCICEAQYEENRTLVFYSKEKYLKFPILLLNVILNFHKI